MKGTFTNKELFESKWRQIRGQSAAWWSLMSDYDLIKVDKATVKLDKYVNLLQVKYGYSRERAKKEIGRRLTEFEAKQKIISHLRHLAG